MEGTIRWLNPHVFLELTAFVNQIDNYIFPHRTGDIDPGSNFFIYVYQQADARLSGGEARIDYHPHAFEWLHLHVSGDILWTRNLDTDNPLPWSPAPRMIVEVELERERMGRVEDISLRLGPSFTQRQTRIDPTETPTPGYTLWDASLSGKVTAGGVTFKPILAVENMFDERYFSHLSRFKAFGVPNYGRNVRFELQVTF